MATPIQTTIKSRSNSANIDVNYKNGDSPYSSISEAKNKIFGDNPIEEKHTGLTVLVKESGWTEAKEYWVQPLDTTPVTYGFVPKQAAEQVQADWNVSYSGSPAFIKNKPTIPSVPVISTNIASDAASDSKTASPKAVKNYVDSNKPSIQDSEQGSTAVTLDGTIHVSAVDAENDENAGVEITPHTGGGVDMKFTLPKGADGQNGITPSIDSTTKQWMIGTTSTGVLAEGHNPNRGTYNVGDTLPSDGIVGDYIVVVDTTQSTPTAEIHKWDATLNNNAGGWAATGVAPSDAEFEDGELVVNTKIDNTQLANPAPNALAKAGDVCGFVGNKLAKVSDEVTVSVDERIERQTAAEIESDGHLNTELSSALNVVDKYNVEDCIYVKVSGYKRSANTSGLLYAFFDTNDTFIRGYQGTTSANLDIYDANIPINASYILIGGNTNGQVPILKKGVLPKTQVEDALDSTSTTAALSANKGKELNDRISQIGENGSTAYYPASLYDDIIEGYMDSEGNTVAASGYAYVGTFVLPETIVKLDVTGYKTSNNTAGLMYVFCDSNGDIITGSGDTVGTGQQTVSLNSIPNGARYIKVMGYKTSASRKYVAVVAVTTTEKMDDYRTIEPDLEYGRIGVGNNTELNGSAFTANLRTSKYIKVYPGSKLLFKTTCDCYMVINRYTSDYQFINYLDAVEMSANVEQEIEVGDTSLIRCNFAKTSSSDTSNIMPKMTLTIKGTIPKDWDLKIENRANEHGVIRIRTIVKTFNPSSCEDETNLVQDTQTRNEDFVLLMLPQSYSNVGKPTRLIIYCHGAGVTYISSTNQFPDTDYRPDYWLSEGYALMDCNAGVQGNPHGVNPSTIQAYITAYKTVVRNYNICTDGVFLGGRSMGGAMSVAISQCKEIPVIANCPVSPVLNTLWWWNYAGATRRANLAANMGFVDYPTGLDNNRITDAEWAAMKANSDKMRKYSPLWTCINDLPTDNAVLYNNDFRYYGSNDDDSIFNEVAAEMALYGSLHIKLPPTKIFHNDHDGSVPYQRNGKPFYKAMVNGGTICEVRLFDVTNDVDNTMNNHHAELRSDRILASYTNSRGEVIENVPVAYIEMLMFWQRYEGSVI